MTTSSMSNTESSPSSLSPQVTLSGTSTTNQTPSIIALNSTQVPIKLSKGGNYTAWKSQFENLLFGYGLMGFLDGTYPCPSEYVKDSKFDQMILIQTTSFGFDKISYSFMLFKSRVQVLHNRLYHVVQLLLKRGINSNLPTQIVPILVSLEFKTLSLMLV